MTTLIKRLYQQRTSLHPLCLPEPNQDNTLLLDLTENNPDIQNSANSATEMLGQYIFDRMRAQQAIYAYGGYLEDRAVYRRSSLFGEPGVDSRSIHLGTDLWAAAGTPVYLPLDGYVHSFQNNAQHGDYGPTIIIGHHLQEISFFTLYGHLTKGSLDGIETLMPLKAGQLLCHIGDAPENGDWPPHLHFQIITDMKGKTGDFPGVAYPREKHDYQKICPDPAVFFQKLFPFPDKVFP